MTLPPGFDGPHIRTEDDPLGEGPICSGCKEDWPCPYVRGGATERARIGAAVRRLPLYIDRDCKPEHAGLVDRNSVLVIVNPEEADHA
jgi:hypothetical protein